ncbi:hypothetical protein [Pseudarthrobacter sp. fls2-241-R2A-127]|uniref:hypothetical protein n=1 Tax=Pseudarthrobacter sp. fls2-241-R2A-127 TaxID=3040303 RepID=UPI0025548976|nr:hypothetical protein [Pseudarthrobacter sp. fls2-241-R2A-127]
MTGLVSNEFVQLRSGKGHEVESNCYALDHVILDAVHLAKAVEAHHPNHRFRISLLQVDNSLKGMTAPWANGRKLAAEARNERRPTGNAERIVVFIRPMA